MKSILLVLFVSVSSAFVLYDDGRESLQSELTDSTFPRDLNYMTPYELPWADERLFYRLLKLGRNNTINQQNSRGLEYLVLDYPNKNNAYVNIFKNVEY